MNVGNKLSREQIFQMAKGFRGRSKNNIKLARLRVTKALEHQYRGRKNKKREARSLWITNINAASREHGVPYHELVDGLKLLEIGLNRKVLAELARTEPYSFGSVVALTKQYVPRPPPKPETIPVKKTARPEDV